MRFRRHKIADQARIAIPSQFPGGLKAGVQDHFGHCDIYPLVELQDGQIARVDAQPGTKG